MSEVKIDFTPALINELKSFLVERIVDNMETKDLEEYVTNDLDQYYENMSDVEFVNEAQNYWDDGFDDVIEEIREYADCDFKKDRREDFLDSLSEGKDLDDYGSKVDALVDSMGVTDEEVSTTHRRNDLYLL
jgi:beta-N-acetylglucosaminidase